MKKIEKVFVFGDSFQYGSELLQALIPDFDIKLKEKTGLTIQPNGIANNSESDPNFHNNLAEICSDYFGSEIHEKKCHSLSMGGLVAEHLNVTQYFNYSRPAMSQIGILTRLLQHYNEIDDSSLVIFGLTAMNRKTRFCARNEPYDMTFFNLITAWKHKEKQEYLELDLEYGDDQLAGYVNQISHIECVHSILKQKNCIYLIIDPRNIYRSSTNKDCINPITSKLKKLGNRNELFHTDLIEIIENRVNELIFEYTLDDAINDLRKTGMESVYCAGGHPNMHVHRKFCENYLFPYVDNAIDTS